MCTGFDSLESLEPFEDLEDLDDFEDLCFFVLLEAGLLLLGVSGPVRGGDLEAGLEEGLGEVGDAGWDEGSGDGSPEVAEGESLPS